MANIVTFCTKSVKSEIEAPFKLYEFLGLELFKNFFSYGIFVLFVMVVSVLLCDERLLRSAQGGDFAHKTLTG